eukprot:SAG11_NODE_37601_length_256_cov_0.656051_1_plen_44_part_10
MGRSIAQCSTSELRNSMVAAAAVVTSPAVAVAALYRELKPQAPQ